MTEKLLFQFENKNEELLSIWHCEKIAESTAFSKFQTMFLETIDAGFATSAHWDMIKSKLDTIEVVYTTTPAGEVIIAVAFEHYRQLNEGCVTFVFVDPAHRTHAFERYRLLTFKFCKKILKSRGVLQITSWINVDNVKSLKIAERRGWTREAIKMVMKL